MLEVLKQKFNNVWSGTRKGRKTLLDILVFIFPDLLVAVGAVLSVFYNPTWTVVYVCIAIVFIKLIINKA